MVTTKNIGWQVNTPDGIGELLYILPDWDVAGKPVAIAVKKIVGDVARVKFIDERGEIKADWFAAVDCEVVKSEKGYIKFPDGDKKVLDSISVIYTEERSWHAKLIEDGSILLQAKFNSKDGKFNVSNSIRLSQKTLLLFTDFFRHLSDKFNIDIESVYKEIYEESDAFAQSVLVKKEKGRFLLESDWSVEYDDSLLKALTLFLEEYGMQVPTNSFRFFGRANGVISFADEKFGELIGSEDFLNVLMDAESVRELEVKQFN